MVCVARRTSRRKKANPITDASVDPVNKMPTSHFRGASGMTSRKSAAMTMQTNRAAKVQAAMAALARCRPRSRL